MIPSNLLEQYSMSGKVSIHDFHMASSVNRIHFTYSPELVEQFIESVKNKETLHYPETDQWLYQALLKYPVSGQEVLIIGSEEPCYEAAAIHYGATVMMVEYQKIISEHSKLSTMTVDEFEMSDKLYDSAISISSIEHSGLGRYGDPLDPDGDLKAMQILKDKLKPGGLCYLAVPMGLDQILWNAHRVYGRVRFPILIDGWEVITSFGFIDSDYEIDESIRRKTGKNPHREGVSGGAHQPIFVLKKK
jgi:hypothetical protein